MIEAELQKQLYGFVLGWLDNAGYVNSAGNAEIKASIISWSLFGAAMQRKQYSSDQPADALAALVATILVEGIEGVPLLELGLGSKTGTPRLA
jgi:hypothetical protein